MVTGFEVYLIVFSRLHHAAHAAHAAVVVTMCCWSFWFRDVCDETFCSEQKT